MGKRNITISIDEELAKEAKIIAAEYDSSLSKILSEQLRNLVEARRQMKTARNDLLRLVKKDFHLDYGKRTFGRDDLHER